MQLDEEVRHAHNLCQTSRFETHARELAVVASTPAAQEATGGGGVSAAFRALFSSWALERAVELGFSEGLDPGCEVFEGG